MNNNHLVLIELLSGAIRNQNPSYISNKAFDWGILFNIAKDHNVHTLLYPIISGLQVECRPDDNLLSIWRREALACAHNQIIHMKKLSDVFHEFYKSDIPVIALKGLVIRQLYPQPDLRTMIDADLLIHSEDLVRAGRLLEQSGYRKLDTSPKHAGYYHEVYPHIELHWALTNPGLFPGEDNNEMNFWNNAQVTDIFDAPVLTLSYDNQILHLLLHMAGHLKGCGFGLRQLCDFVLAVEAYKDSINLETVLGNASQYGLAPFSRIIFIICNRLFDLQTPDLFKVQEAADENYLNALIDDILSGGVYGAGSNQGRIRGMVLHNSPLSSGRPVTNNLSYLSLLFPSARTISSRYSYARKIPILLPIAWLHRIIFFIFRRDMVITDKSTIISGKSSKALKDRYELLKWLELR